MYAKPTAPQRIGQVLDGAFRLTRASLGRTWPLALCAGLVGALASIYQLFSGLEPAALARSPVFWIAYVVGIFASLLFIAAIFLRIDAVASGAETAPNPLAGALRRLPALFALTLLYVLAIVVGTVLLIVPGILFSVSLMLATPILLLDGKGPFAALSGSHRLVWGHWWRTFSIISIGGVIVMVLYFVIAFAAGFIAPMVGARDPVLAGTIVLVVVIGLVSTAITPFFSSLVLNVYWELKLRREGGDLAARAEAI
jgi:hypothetical protein